MANRIILKAMKGYVYTNGDTFVTTVELPHNANVDVWREIPEEEAIKIQQEMEKEI